MKRVLSFMLAFTMILLACPLASFAEPGVQSGSASSPLLAANVCSILTTNNISGVQTEYKSYDSLDQAMEGLKDIYEPVLANPDIKDSSALYIAAGSPVIRLNGNIRARENTANEKEIYPDWWTANSGGLFDANKIITVVIDGASENGGNYTITYGSESAQWNSYAFEGLGYYNFSMRNVNMVINRGNSTLDGFFRTNRTVSANRFAVSTSTYTNFENCSIVENSTLSSKTSGAGGLFKMRSLYTGNSHKHSMTFTDCSVTSGTSLGIYVLYGSNAPINMEISLVNTKWTHQADVGNTSSGTNCAPIAFQSAATGSIRVDGTSVITSRKGAATEKRSILQVNGTGVVTVTLEKGAQLYLNDKVSSSASPVNKFIDVSDTTTIIDKGAVFQASAADVAAGVHLPSFKTGAEVHTWKANGTEITSTTPYKTNPTTAVIFTHGIQEVIPEPQEPAETLLTSKVCTIYYMNTAGEQVAYKTYDTLDAAFDGMRDLYVGPVTGTDINGNAVEKIYQDTDGDGTLTNELYAAAGSPVIKLNGNFNAAYVRPNWATTDTGAFTGYYLDNNGESLGSDVKYDKRYTVKFVVDGETASGGNTTLYYDSSSVGFNVISLYSICFHNVTFRFNRGDIGTNTLFDSQGVYYPYSASTEVSFRDCSLIESSSLSGNNASGALFKQKNSDASGVVQQIRYLFKNTAVISDTALGLYVFNNSNVHTGSSATVRMENSTWRITSDIANTSTNCCIFQIFQGASFSFYMDETSRLISARGANAPKASIFELHGKGQIRLTFAKGSQLLLENAATGMASGRSFINVDNTGGTYITDNGAIWKASANDVKKGVNLPTCFSGHVWLANNAKVSSATPYTAGVSSAVIFTHATQSEADAIPSNVAYLSVNGEKTYYASVAAAVNALGAVYDAVTTPDLTHEALWQAAGCPVIYIYKDIAMTETIAPAWWNVNKDNDRVRTVCIKADKSDGTNVKLTYTDETVFNYLAHYDLKVENVDFVANRTAAGKLMFVWNGNQGGLIPGEVYTVFKNCNITDNLNKAGSGDGITFKVNGNKKVTSAGQITDGTDVTSDIFHITFENTNIQSAVAVGMLIHWGSDADVAFRNSSWLQTGNSGYYPNGNDSIIRGMEAGKISIDLDGASMLASARTGGSKGGSLIRISENCYYPAGITLGEGAALTLDNNSSAITNMGFIYALNGNTVVRDNGAVLKVSFLEASGCIWVNGEGKAVAVKGNTYEPSEATETYSAMKIQLSTGGATMHSSTSVSFDTLVSDGVLGILGDENVKVEFGTLIGNNAPLYKTVLTLEAQKKDPANIVDIPNGDRPFQNDGSGSYYTAFRTVSDDVEGYFHKYRVRGYVTITIGDGAPQTYYSDSTVVKSLYDAAKAQLADPSYVDPGDVAKTVVYKVNASKVLVSRQGWLLDKSIPSYWGGTLGKVAFQIGQVQTFAASNRGGKLQLINDTNATEYAQYIDLLEKAGFCRVSATAIGENRYAQYLRETTLLYVYYTASQKQVRVIHDTASVPENEFEYSYQPKPGDTTTFYQYALMYSPTGNGNVAPYHNAGMLNIIKLADNSVVLMDGGSDAQSTPETVKALMGFLRTITDTPTGKVRIAALYFTHGHGDHVFLVRDLLATYGDQIVVERLMHNFIYDGCSQAFKDVGNMLKTNYPDAKFIKLHTGQKVTLANVTFDVVYTQEDRANGNNRSWAKWQGGDGIDYNNASTILKMTMNGRTFMLFGDWGGNHYYDTDTARRNEYKDMSTNLINSMGSFLKADVIQISHHAINDFMADVYSHVKPTYAFFPQQDIAYHKMAHPCYKKVVDQLRKLGVSDSNMFFGGRYTYGLSVSEKGVFSVSYREIEGADANYATSLAPYQPFRNPTGKKF